MAKRPADRKGENERKWQKDFRDKKRADGYVHLQKWVHISNKKKIVQFIDEIEKS